MKLFLIIMLVIFVSAGCLLLLHQETETTIENKSIPVIDNGIEYLVPPDSVKSDIVIVVVNVNSNDDKPQPKKQQEQFNSFKDLSGKYPIIYDLWFKKYSKRFFGYGFDWRWFKAQGVAESSLNPGAQSYCKAQGIMQIVPGTHDDILKRHPWIEDNIFSPRWNIAAGIAYDKQMWNYWEGFITNNDEHIRFMFGSYNGGYGNIKYAVGLLRDHFITISWDNVIGYSSQFMQGRWNSIETGNYVNRVFEVYEGIRGNKGYMGNRGE